MKRNLTVLALAVLVSSIIAGCSSGDTMPPGAGKVTQQIDTHLHIHRPHAAAAGGGAPNGNAPAQTQPQ